MTPSQPVSTISSRPSGKAPRRPAGLACVQTPAGTSATCPPPPGSPPSRPIKLPVPAAHAQLPPRGSQAGVLECSPHPIPTWDTMKPFVYSVRSRKPCSCGELILGLRPNRAPGRPSCAECGSVSTLGAASRSLPLPLQDAQGEPRRITAENPISLIKGTTRFQGARGTGAQSFCPCCAHSPKPACTSHLPPPHHQLPN